MVISLRAFFLQIYLFINFYYHSVRMHIFWLAHDVIKFKNLNYIYYKAVFNMVCGYQCYNPLENVSGFKDILLPI